MPPLFNDTEVVSRSIALLVRHAERLARRRWRQLVWLQGDTERCQALAVALWQAQSWCSPLWVAEGAPVTPALKAGRSTTRLGSEHQLVVVDAHSAAGGFNPDALGAIGERWQQAGYWC